MDKWNKYFMDIAIRTSELSKDIKTKVGAVIVKDNKILSIGYNGAPKNFNDKLVPNDNNSDKLIEQKNSFMVHAELNAVINYAGKMTDLNGSTIYVTVSPCYECAKIIAQLGISKVIYLEKYHNQDFTDTSFYILEQCGVSIQKFKEK